MPAIAVVPIVVEVTEQVKFLSTPASATGGATFTFTVTVLVAVHPLLPVTVTVYVVVTDGAAVGFETNVELNPVEGLQL